LLIKPGFDRVQKMDITYLGHSSFKIKTKSATVITDPFDPKFVGLKYSGVEGEIVTVSHSHSDHNAADKVSGVKKVIDGPGEYEIAGVSIMGYQTFHDDKSGEDRGKNTVFIIEADGLRVAHLGDLGHPLSDDLVDEIGDIDVLIIPIGGTFTIGPKEATEVVSKVEPYFVIPMHYKTPGLNAANFDKLEPVETFLKESGLPVENSPKFSLKKEDILEDQNTKVVVLEKK
jgi:L-ascorbate metabolism protein UlaG (beta-lactamase superfamily)